MVWRRLGIWALVAVWPAALPAQEQASFVAIFNGTDLAGWQVPSDKDRWSVDDGNLCCRSGPQRHGSILWTEKSYRDFVLQLKFRFVAGTVDSGVFLRNENEQIQIGQSGSLQRDMTGSPYIASRRGYPVEAEGVSKLLQPEDWNELRIAAVGRDYRVWLNGQQVLTWDSDTAAETGPIGLQLHEGREMAIDFRESPWPSDD